MPQKKQQVKFSFGTQAEYNALPIKDQNTFYIITDTQKIYIGNKMYTSKITIENLDDNLLSALYSNATQDTNGLMSAADKTKLDNLPSNIVYLSHAEYNELTQPDSDTLYIFTDGGSNEGTSMVQQINRYIPRRLMKQHIDEAEIGQATEEIIKTSILSEQGKNISNWTKSISPLPQFINVYNNGNNNLTYTGGAGYERIYFPITTGDKGIRFEFDYKTSTGFNCMYGSNEDYAFISLVIPTQATGLNYMDSVPVKVALSSTASNTTNHYCLDYWGAPNSVIYIGFDFGYIEDGVQTIFDFNNIECSEIDTDIEIVITPST